mgnify:CR=1 FL=1
MQYDFVPMPHRKTLKWPYGKRMALILTTNLEYWEPTKDTDRVIYPGGPGIVGGTLSGNVYDNPNWTWREYGHRVGVWRIFDLFEEAGVPTSCTINALMGIERRAVVDHAVKKGYEIVAHNYEQTELLTDFQDDEEKEKAVFSMKTLTMEEREEKAYQEKENGNLKYKSSQYQEAIMYYRAARKYLPPPRLHAVCWSNESAAHGGLGNWKRASECAKECISIDPHYTKGYVRHSKALER